MGRGGDATHDDFLPSGKLLQPVEYYSLLPVLRLCNACSNCWKGVHRHWRGAALQRGECGSPSDGENLEGLV
eukprot:363493-Chlamydomonas_euryale.AAC.11